MPLKTIEHAVAPELAIDLPKPIRAAEGGELTQLVLREPSAGKVQAAEHELTTQAPAAQRRYQAKLVALVAGTTPEALADLPISLITRAAAHVIAPTRIDLAAMDDLKDFDQLNMRLSEPVVTTKHSVDVIEVREPTPAMVEKAERLLVVDGGTGAELGLRGQAAGGDDPAPCNAGHVGARSPAMAGAARLARPAHEVA